MTYEDLANNEMRLAIPILILCTGCATVTPQLDVRRLPGIYRTGDGFWPRMLELNADGTYFYIQMTDVITEDKDGRLVFEGGWSLSGRWNFRPSDRLELTAGEAMTTLLVREEKSALLTILEPDLVPNILSRWKADAGWSYLRKEKSNATQQPTR